MAAVSSSQQVAAAQVAPLPNPFFYGQDLPANTPLPFQVASMIEKSS